jgi:YD repeat-containing protein
MSRSRLVSGVHPARQLARSCSALNASRPLATSSIACAISTNAAGALLDSAATGHTYDSLGNATSDIANYSNGTVTNPGDNITPNATTNARTDLTTAYTYDTAGNRVSTADPRRAIETAKGTSLSRRRLHRPLDLRDARRDPDDAPADDPHDLRLQPEPGLPDGELRLRRAGGIRESTGQGGVVSGTEADRLDHGTRTFEDTDGAGSTAAAVTSTTTFDAAGRVLTAKDRNRMASTSTAPMCFTTRTAG